MKRTIVTGGAGFIGSHLAEELAGRGYEVVILDDLSTGRMGNIEQLLERDNVRFVSGSIINLSLLQGLFQNVDYVFHQAAIPSVPRSIEDPQATHEANITGTLNVLLAAKDRGISKVIYASSSSVYGSTPTLPKVEDMPTSPESPYAVAKLAGEYYCRVFHEVYKLPTVCLRYFNVYGPKQDPNSQYAAVVPSFIKRILEDSPPIIFGDGEQTRDFTFVSDVVAANIWAAENDDATGVFNIGRGASMTINQLAQLVVKLVGKDVEPAYGAPRSGDVRHSLADVSRAKILGYTAKCSLEEGLEKTIRRFSHDA